MMGWNPKTMDDEIDRDTARSSVTVEPAWAMEMAQKLDMDILDLAYGTGPAQHQNKLCWLARALVDAQGNGILIGLESAAKNYIAGRNEAFEEAALAADGFTGSLEGRSEGAKDIIRYGERVRNEALEEAALAADGFTGSLLHNHIADRVAAAIRALKSPRQDD